MFRWLLRRLLALCVGAFALVVVLSAPQGIVAVGLWAAIAYLTWRAWPSVKVDAARVTALFGFRRGRHGGGLLFRGGDTL